jgi:hypothetical protein
MDAARGADDLKEISRRSPEKFKLGFKPFIRPLVKYDHVRAPAQRSALRLAANKPTKPAE